MRINASSSALVTGGASGLGRATAERLVANGARFVILDLARRSSPTRC
ncbi:SDR family NAD(P)-dependent oxidoreductase [Streptomyces sp. NPDC056656]